MKNCKHCGDVLNESKRNGYSCNTCKNGLDRYNLNKLDMLNLHQSQKGKCKLCSEEVDMFVKYHGGYIDHNHDTGKVRGILCHPCNISVGYLENKSIDLDVLKSYINQ
jgi:hypothetical protein